MTIDGVLQLAATMQASDPRVGATWSSLAPDAPGSPMCVNEPTRDGVVVGAVSFTNETPTYPPTNVVIPLFGSTSDINAQLSFEIHYANSDANCAYVNPGDAVIRPEMSGATWGPVPVAFVIPNMYGPDGPDMTTFETAQSDLALGPSNQNMEAGAGMTDQGGYYLHFTLPPPSS